MRKNRGIRIFSLLLAAMILFSAAPVLAMSSIEGVGTQLQDAAMPFARQSTLHTVMMQHLSAGRQQEQIIEYQPGGAVTPVTAYGSKLYGTSTISAVAQTLAESGKTVVAGINADFFQTDTGIPIGMVVTDGIVRTSDAGANAVGFTDQGETVIGKPQLSIQLTASDGQTVGIDYINKTRKYYGVYLFTPDFSATTRVSSKGHDVVLGNIQGELKIGGTVTATVMSSKEGSGAITLDPGMMVLSGEASQKMNEKISGLTEGMTVTITVRSADARWENVRYAVGAGDTLVEGGGIAPNLGTAAAPRTAVGVKADGSLVLYTVDGRQSGWSNGSSLQQLAQRMLSLGCVAAVNMDGGGSTGIMVRQPGESGMSVVNQPSDGSLRRCANYIFLVSNTAPTGNLSLLHLYPCEISMMPGAETTFSIKATDEEYYPVTAPQYYSYGYVEGDIGAWREDGAFVAGGSAGTGRAYVSSGAATGSASIRVTDRLSSINLLYESSGKGVDAAITVGRGQQIDLKAQGYEGNLPITGQDHLFTWTVTEGLGTIDPNGVFTSALDPQVKTGTITVSYGGATKSVSVSTEKSDEIVEDFEQGAPGIFAAAPGITFAAQNVSDYVKFGLYSGRLSYDFTESEILSLPVSYTIPSAPYLDLWVYGDGSGTVLSLETDVGTVQLGALNFTGYQKLTATLPSGATALTGIVLQRSSAAQGTIYLDQMYARFGTTNDVTAPVVTLSARMSGEGTVTVEGSVKDAGLPLRTRSVALTMDSAAQQFSYDEQTGTLSATLPADASKPHYIAVVASDAAGNLARASFAVGTASSPFADTSGHWSRDFADYLYSIGIISGVEVAGNRLFMPDDDLTRAQFAIMMSAYLGVSTDQYSDVVLPFDDLTSLPSWALPEIRAMYSMGILRGRATDGKVLFSPNEPITRAEIMTVFARILPKGYPQQSLSFSDAGSIPEYARSSVAQLLGMGIVSGYIDGTVRPQAGVRRGEAAKMFSLLY